MSSIRIIRLIALVALLAGTLDVSKVVCISPGGHHAVEDSAAHCCLSAVARPAVSIEEVSPCQGCTDLPLITAFDRKSAQSPALVNATVPVLAAADFVLSPATADLLPLPAASPLSTTSLRC